MSAEGQFLSAAVGFVWATRMDTVNAPEIRNKPHEMIWGSSGVVKNQSSEMSNSED